MYIAKIPNRNSPPTYLLRESYRENGKVKNRTLANVSALPQGQIDLLSRVLRGETLVPADEALHILHSLPCGHVRAVLTMLRQLGLESLIASRPCRERNLVVAMIAQRILYPSSKLAATRLWATTTLAEEVGVQDANVDELYAALDWLLVRQKRIEKKLAQRHLVEGNRVFYDVSSSSYFGHTCLLARLGHNRAHLFVCLLAYYVQWHLKQAWASLLFADEHLDEHRTLRDPVAQAKPHDEVCRKKATRLNEDGYPLHSFRTLLATLATQCHNTCQFGNSESAILISKITESTPLQTEAFRLLQQERSQ